MMCTIEVQNSTVVVGPFHHTHMLIFHWTCGLHYESSTVGSTSEKIFGVLIHSAEVSAHLLFSSGPLDITVH